MNARKVYTVNVNGTDYDFRFTSPDGKHVVMQEKKTGTKEERYNPIKPRGYWDFH